MTVPVFTVGSVALSFNNPFVLEKTSSLRLRIRRSSRKRRCLVGDERGACEGITTITPFKINHRKYLFNPRRLSRITDRVRFFVLVEIFRV